MDAKQIAESLIKSGYQVLETQADAVIMEDPTCIIRSLMNFINFAGTAVGALAALMLFGWAIALIRGANIDIRENLKNLFLLFGGLALIPALIRFLADQNVMECRRIQIPVSEINNILALKKSDFAKQLNTVKTESRTGFINNHPMVDAQTILSPAEIGTFQRVIGSYGLRIRGCEAEGCGNLGARRVNNGPAEHEGSDLYRAPGDPVPSMFDGTIIGIDNKYSGLKGMTIRNDNGTTTYYGYVSSNGLKVGDKVRAGQVVAIQQDLKMHPDYANVPNHVHFELWSGNGRSQGAVVNTEGLF